MQSQRLAVKTVHSQKMAVKPVQSRRIAAKTMQSQKLASKRGQSQRLAGKRGQSHRLTGKRGQSHRLTGKLLLSKTFTFANNMNNLSNGQGHPGPKGITDKGGLLDLICLLTAGKQGTLKSLAVPN